MWFCLNMLKKTWKNYQDPVKSHHMVPLFYGQMGEVPIFRHTDMERFGQQKSDVLIRIVTLREMQKSIPLFSPKQVDVIEPGNAWGVPGSKSLGVEWSGYSLVI